VLEVLERQWFMTVFLGSVRSFLSRGLLFAEGFLSKRLVWISRKSLFVIVPPNCSYGALSVYGSRCALSSVLIRRKVLSEQLPIPLVSHERTVERLQQIAGL
jgi:hypothetical protein